MRRLLVLSVAVVSSSAAFGQEEERGPYVGLGFGQLDYEDAAHRIDFGDTASLFKLTAGFRFSDGLGFEVNFGESGDIVESKSGAVGGILPNDQDPNNPGGGQFTGTFAGDFEYTEIRLMAYAKHVLFGFGFFSSDFAARFTGNSVLGPFATSVTDSESGFTVAIGAEWDIAKWAIRAEYEYFDMSSPADASTLGVGVNYKF